MEHRFRANDAALRWLLDSLSTAIVLLDRQCQVGLMNSAAENLFSVSFRQCQGLPLAHLAEGTDALLPGLRRCLETGHPYTERELSLRIPGEHGITVDCTVTPVMEHGVQAWLVMEIRRVDRQLKINREEHLIAQHNNTRALLRNLAHEIKNPLGGLRGAAQLLEGELAHEELKEYTQVIIGEADRLRNLVDRMLGPSHPPVYANVNIHQILERVRTLVLAEASNGLEIHQDYDPSIPDLRGDADQLIQAILNIVRNAVQVLEGQGVVTLRTRIERHYTIGPVCHRLVARVDIIDNGPGIPDEQRQVIFFPMISGRASGTGLGLSISQILIHRHGGLIECQSRPGETIFTLLLPLEKVDD